MMSPQTRAQSGKQSASTIIDIDISFYDTFGPVKNGLVIIGTQSSNGDG